MNFLKYTFLAFVLISIFACQNGSPLDSTKNEMDSIVVDEVPIDSESDARETWQKPNLILDKMGDLSDRRVADIGAGTGYFSFRMVPRAKKVVAIEIDKDLIILMNNLSSSLSDANKSKFETRLAKPDDPELESNEVDDILIVNVAAYFDDRVDYFRKCKNALSDIGKIHIIDYKVRRLPIEAPEYSDRVYIHLIEDDLEAAGFTDIVTDDTSLDYQYIVQASIAQ